MKERVRLQRREHRERTGERHPEERSKERDGSLCIQLPLVCVYVCVCAIAPDGLKTISSFSYYSVQFN